MQKALRVAIIAPPFGEIGGPELTTIQLADALVANGVSVSLFAPANFTTQAKIVPTMDQGLSTMSGLADMSIFERRNLIISSQIKILALQDDFDIIHISSQRYGYALGNNIHKPMVITLHNQMKLCDYNLLKKTGITTIALTKKYKELIKADEYIYPGIPLEKIKSCFEKGDGLIFIGRLTEQKGVHVAIEIAQKANKKLTIVGRIGSSAVRRQYFENQIKPQLKKDSVVLIEEISNTELMKLLSKSEALLFPIIRPETFGRVSIEALACGTPVIGTCIDPLPEILKNKKIACLSNNIDDLVLATKNTNLFDRKACRDYAEKYFNISTTAKKHIELYKKIIAKANFK